MIFFVVPLDGFCCWFFKHLNRSFNLEAQSFQYKARDTVRVASECSRDLFVDVPCVIYKTLGLDVGHVTWTGELAKPGTSLSQTICWKWQSHARKTQANSSSVPMYGAPTGPALSFPGAYGLRNHLRKGAYCSYTFGIEKKRHAKTVWSVDVLVYWFSWRTVWLPAVEFWFKWVVLKFSQNFWDQLYTQKRHLLGFLERQTLHWCRCFDFASRDWQRAVKCWGAWFVVSTKLSRTL